MPTTGLLKARSLPPSGRRRVVYETNALMALTEAITAVDRAKLEYQQAKTEADKKSAISKWRVGLEQLSAIPPTTLAGRQAQQKLASAERDFQEVVGLMADRQRINSYISTAREYAKRAADMGRNPPHTVARWQQIKEFWQEAIAELEKIPDSDIAGYKPARRLIAEYKLQLAEVNRRMIEEQNSLQAYESAQDQIDRLIANAEQLDRLQMVASLRQIMRELDKVSSGTTSYAKAQQLKVYTQNFLAKVQAGTKVDVSKPR